MSKSEDLLPSYESIVRVCDPVDNLTGVELNAIDNSQPGADVTTPVVRKRIVFKKQKAATLLLATIFLSLVIFIFISICKSGDDFELICVYPRKDMKPWTASINSLGWMMFAFVHTLSIFMWTFTIIMVQIDRKGVICWSLGIFVFFIGGMEVLMGGVFGEMFTSYHWRCFKESPAFAAWMIFGLFPWIIIGLFVSLAVVCGLVYFFVRYVIPCSIVNE